MSLSLKKSITLSLFSFSILIVCLVSLFVLYSNAKGEDSSQDDVRVIVELEDPPLLHSLSQEENSAEIQINQVKSMKTSLIKSHEHTLNQARKKGIDFKKAKDYTLSFNGIALKVPKEQLDELSALPGVKKVHTDHQFNATLLDSVPLIGAPEVWETPNENNSETTGKGINVAVIDTGVDYTHPDLGGKFGPGNKVAAGYDFVNDDPDPMDDNLHGTHVAGIIAANGELKGVAPDATIIAYKVLNEFGTGYESDILAALEEAVDPENPFRADVINMSLGGPGDGNDPLTIAVENAVESGISVIVAAGNSGHGYDTISSPGGAEGALTVGASISGVKVPELSMIAPEKRLLSSARLEFSANPNEGVITTELVDIGEGLPEDYEGKDVKGKTLLMEYTPLNIDRAIYAEEQGAQAILFYENVPSFPGPLGNGKNRLEVQQHQFEAGTDFNGRLNTVVAAEINEETANLLKSHLTNGTVKIAINSEDAADQIPAFSSRGTTAQFKMAPDLVAPGVEINSTVPKALYEPGYYRVSGTSMAAPHVAGAVALLMELHPDWEPDVISDALVGTAKPLEQYDPLIQGAGRLDVQAAAQAFVSASPRKISFGLADLAEDTVEEHETFTLTNFSEEPVNIELSVKNHDENSTVRLSTTSLQLDPGQETEIEVSISLERPDASANCMGWIEAKVEGDAPDLRIPYFLAVRPLQLYASPDPAISDSEVFIYSSADLESAPTVTIQSPDGDKQEIEAIHDHDRWWRAPVQAGDPGIYHITAKATSSEFNQEDSVVLYGTSTLEVTETQKGDSGVSNWQAVGPNAIGGQLLIDSNNNKTMKALHPTGLGYFFTDNKNDAWKERRNFPVAGGMIVNAVADPTEENKIYVAINGGSTDPTYRGKVLQSDDGGLSWTSLPFPNVELSGLQIDETGNVLFGITESAIYISQNQGKSWEPVSGEWNTVNDTQLVDTDLYVATQEGLYVVKNVFEGGGEIELLFEPLGNLKWVKEVEGNSEVLLAVSYMEGLFVSFDQGKTWEQVHDPMGSLHLLKMIDNKIYTGTTRELWVSEDYGETWQSLKDPLPSSMPTDIVQSKSANGKISGSTFVIAPNGGIFETDDNGLSYRRIGLPGATVYDIALSEDLNGKLNIIAGTQYDTYRKQVPASEKIDSSTLEWGESGGEGYVGKQILFVKSSPDDPSAVFKIRMGALSTFYVDKSEDGGETWTNVTSNTELPQAFLIHPANPSQLYISYWSLKGSGLLISEDAGETWMKKDLGREILAIAADPENPERFWTGGADGLYVTNDGGETFDKLQDTPINSLAVDPNNPEKLIIGGHELYYSIDGGHTLKDAEYSNLPFLVNDIVFSTNNSDTIYAATGSYYDGGLLKGGRGVLRSTDGGQTWRSFSAGLANKNTTSLAITPDAKYLYVGTVGGSAHRVKLNQGN
ncbi:MAG TPA: S8 family serine peptidase [Bacillus sp. (in: firmicutes)]|uniref:S8 family serine peptidase n=1 Tax=Bacillus litorisediminis TaxID=2922713 RepID=UPI002434EE42|nr:S8 family serine peptidase [Bacillus litorisediminis]HWO75460.1 S8 family serine peptidase [Bacillus sp. (in: firmicutes)]